MKSSVDNISFENIGTFLGEKNLFYAKAFNLYKANGFKLLFNKEILSTVAKAFFVALAIVAVLANNLYKSEIFSKIGTNANSTMAVSFISLIAFGALSPSIFLFYRKIFKWGFIALLVEKAVFTICGYLLQSAMLFFFPAKSIKPAEVVSHNGTLELISYSIVAIILLLVGSFVYTYFVYKKYKSIEAQPHPDFIDEGKKGRFLASIGTFMSIAVTAIFVTSFSFALIYYVQSTDNLYQGDLAYEKKEYKKAQKYFIKACENGEALACNNLGVMYKNGTGVGIAHMKAVRLFKKSCEGGEKLGCDNYKKFKKEDQKYRKNAQIYEKLCDNGDEHGCINLADMYKDGKGVEQDHKKAMNIYTSFCNDKTVTGCVGKGRMYLFGLGVEKDKHEANFYFRMACDGGDEMGCISANLESILMEAILKSQLSSHAK